MICRKEKMARVKMNNEYRTKISNQVRNALDNDKLNSKREAYQQHLELVKEQYPKFFDEAKTIVKRSYPKEHCDTLKYFKDPCFKALILSGTKCPKRLILNSVLTTQTLPCDSSDVVA